jgi:hypothetical protein
MTGSSRKLPEADLNEALRQTLTRAHLPVLIVVCGSLLNRGTVRS